MACRKTAVRYNEASIFDVVCGERNLFINKAKRRRQAKKNYDGSNDS